MEKTNTEPYTFLFERPPYVGSLSKEVNIILAHGSLASRLTAEQRTRTYHPDGRRENVAEHGFMLAKVAVALADELYPWLDRGKVAIYSIDHDDVEAYVGDTPTDSIAGHDKDEKKRREAFGEDRLVSEYVELSPGYVQDVVEYENQVVYEAQFVRIVDKMMVLLIHLPNHGDSLRQNYSYQQCLTDIEATERELLEQYPHFIELIQIRSQLARHVLTEVFQMEGDEERIL
jgi:5'-deoxynucleotidase YfbR-like HD superfamily hydrolase